MDLRFVKPEMMRAEIRLANPESYVRLFHAFEAIHDAFSHDDDVITFHNDDGMSLHMNASDNYVSFGPATADESDRVWSANTDVGEMRWLLLHFMRREYEALQKHAWSSREPDEEGTGDPENAEPGGGE